MANTVRNMHYDFKQKLNKVDSQQNLNFRVPEIDWKLNEALYVFIKMIAQPRVNPIQGFEQFTRTVDDIRMLVVDNQEISVSDFKTNVVRAGLPADYIFYVSSRSSCTKGTCEGIEIKNTIQKHGRDFEDDLFEKSSFEWREVNGLFVGNYLHLYSDGTFTIEKLLLDYIRKPLYIHSAVDAVGGKYYMPDGTTELTGFQNCELPDIVHHEIVDLAVLIATGDLISDYQAKYSKIKITD